MDKIDIDNMIGEGDEVKAYKDGDNVIKFYKKYCRKIRMNRTICDVLSNIRTNRILLPTSLILNDEYDLYGYIMKYVRNLGEDSFYNLSKKKLSLEMNLVIEDIEILSDNGILIDDLTHENTIYNKGIYLIDPGSYTYSEKDKNESIKTFGINMDMVNEYLLLDIIKRRSIKLCKDNIKADRGMKNFRDDTYYQASNPLLYLKDKMEYNSIDDLILHYIDKVNNEDQNSKKRNFNKSFVKTISK